jgi:hypothetical protein
MVTIIVMLLARALRLDTIATVLLTS